MTAGLEWILVRHGETEWTEKKLLHGGHTDARLSAEGGVQAERTAQWLRKENITAIYSSPQGRAMETAETIGNEAGIGPEPIEGFREYDFGWLEGKPLLSFGRDGTSPKILKPFADLLRILTGEPYDAFHQRVMQGVREIINDHDQGRIVIVTHWGVLSLIVAILLEEDFKYWMEKRMWAACGITRMKFEAGRWKMVQCNSTEHLQEMGKRP